MNLDWSKVKDAPLNEAFENYSYESQIFLKNYQYKFGIWMILFAGLPFTLILKQFNHRYFNFFRKLDKFYRYNGVLQIMKELYLEMGVYAFLNFYKPQFSNKEGLIVTSIAYAAMAWIIVFPIITFNLI